MAAKKKTQKKKPDGRGSRPRDPNQLALWVVQQSTAGLTNKDKPKEGAQGEPRAPHST